MSEVNFFSYPELTCFFVVPGNHRIFWVATRDAIQRLWEESVAPTTQNQAKFTK